MADYAAEVLADAPIMALPFDDQSVVVSGLLGLATTSSSDYTPIVGEYVETNYIDYGDGTAGSTSRALPVSIGVTTNFSFTWVGYFVAPLTGTYTFGSQSDDNSTIIVGTTTVVTRGAGPFSTAETTGTIALTAGQTYFFRYRWSQGTGAWGARVRWQAPGGSMAGLFAASNSVTLPFVTPPRVVDVVGGRQLYQFGNQSYERSVVPNLGGRSMRFDGVEDMVHFRDATLNITSPYTIECWITFNALPTGSQAPQIFCHPQPGPMPICLGFMSDTTFGKLFVGFYTGSAWQRAMWSVTPSINTRYHLVGIWDGTTLRLRVNDTEVVTATPTAGTVPLPATVASNQVRIGARWDTGEYLNADLDHLSLYNYRVSDARLSVHYAAGLENAAAASLSAASALAALPDNSTSPNEYLGEILLSGRGDLAVQQYLLKDSYERTDSTSVVGGPEIGSAGTAHTGTWGLLAGSIYASTVVSSDAIYTYQLNQTDYDVTTVLTNASISMALVFRAVDGSNFLMLHLASNTAIDFYQRVAGTYTQLDTVAVAVYPGSELRVVCIGTRIWGYMNGRLFYSREEGRFANATRVGFRVANSTHRFASIQALAPLTPVPGMTGEVYDLNANADGSTTGYLYKGRDNASLDSLGSAP